MAADVGSAMGEVAEAHAELRAGVGEVLHGLGVREVVDRFVGYVLAGRPFALRVVEQTPELRGVGGTAVELLTAIAGGFERSAWSVLEGGSAARDAFVTALAGWGVRFDGGLLPVLMDELPEGVDVRGVLGATVMRRYTEGLLGVEALVVGWPGDGLSIRAWHVSGFDAAFEQQFPPDLGVDARFSSYSVLVVDSQAQQRAPVVPQALPVRSQGPGPRNFFVGARDRSLDDGSGHGGSGAGTGDFRLIADGGRPVLTAATVPPGMAAPVEGGAGFGGAAKQAVTAAETVDIPSTDPSWLRSRAKTASWFDPEPVPLRRDQWEKVRQAKPDFSVQSELWEVAGNSTPRSIVGTEQLVRYDVRRIKVEGRWVQEYTLKFFLENDSLMGSIDRATVVEKLRAAADRYFNQGYRFPSGEQFHVRVEFPDDPENAHQAISQDGSMQVSHAELARILGLYLGILDETPQQRWPGYDDRGVFHRDDMPVSKNQRIAIPRRNRVYGDESVMWSGSRGGRLLPRHLAQLEESTRAYGFRPGAADAGSPTLAAIRSEDFGSVAQWRASTLDKLLSQKEIDVDSVMDALRSVRGKRIAVEGLYREFQAHTGRKLDSVLADVLGGEDAAYAAQLLGIQPDSPDTGDPEPPFTSVPPGLGYTPHLRRDVFEYAAAVRGHVSTGLGASDPVVREQSFEAAMRLMRVLDRELRKIWAVQLAYTTQFGSDLRTDLIELRSDYHEAIGNVLGDVISPPTSMENIIEWHRKLKNTTFENYSLGKTPVRYDHPEEGCWLRAHAWVMDLVRMGASPMKIFVARTDPDLSFYSPYAEGASPGTPAKVEHRFHVAPMVTEHTPSGPRFWVLDWAISANGDDHAARPLTMEEWLRQMGVNAYDESVTYYSGTAEQILQQFTDDCRIRPSRTYDDGGAIPQGRAIVLLAPAHFYGFPQIEKPEAIPRNLFEADLWFRGDESSLISMNRTAERRAGQRLEEAPGVIAEVLGAEGQLLRRSGPELRGGSSDVSSPEDAPDVVVELAGLVGRMEGHLAALPADFRPDVRAGVGIARAMVQQEGWTPADLRWISSHLEGMRAAEQWSREAAELAESLSGGGGSSFAGGSAAGSLSGGVAVGAVKPAMVVESGIMMSSDLDEDVRAVARGFPVEDGRLAVWLKGNGHGGVLIGGESVDAWKLASLIRARMVGKRSIRLYAGEVSEQFARELDGALDAEVVWTPDMVFGPETNGFGAWNTTRSERVLGSGAEEIPAGIMVSPSDLDEDTRAAARGLPVEDGRLAVVVKGDGRGGVLIGGESADARQLADLIRSRMGGRRSIRLYACGISEEFARELDGALDAEAIWTRGIVWFGPATMPFASMVGGWYLDEHSKMRPNYSQGSWETTRKGEWQPGQAPADVSLPPGQTGLSPNWVHLRTEPARFRTEPRPDLASLRNSDHIGKVARARSQITTADDQLTQIYNMVDAPAPEAPPTTVTAADSAETDALLKTATDETTSAAASVERARQQAEKLTAAQQDLTAARQRQDELRAELDAARQNLIQKRRGFLRVSRERAQLLRNQHENQGPVPDALLLAQRADAEARAEVRVETAAAEFTAVRERIEQLETADQEASERTAEAIARAENERGATAEAAKTATKALTQARIAADRADVTVRQVDLPPYAADGAMGSGKIWQTGNIDPEDVLTALPEDLREPARAAIEELFSDAKLTRTLRRLADEGIRIEVSSRELHLKFERTASTPVRLPQADGVLEYGIRYADAGLTVGQEQSPQFGMLGVVPNMVGAAAKGAVRNVIFNPSVRPSMGKSEQRSLVSTTEFSRGLSSRVPERNFVVDGRFVIDVQEGENPPETYRTDEITDVALICYDGEDVPPATTKPGPDDPVLPLPASALHEVFAVPQAAAMRRIRQQVLAKLPLSEVGVGVRDSVSRELAEDKAIVKFEEITGGGYRPSPLRLPGAKLNTLSLEVSAELRSVRRVDSRVVPAVNLGQNAGSDTKFDTSETQSANAEASAMVGPGFVADVNEKRRGLGSYTTITPFTVSGSAGSGESLTQVLGISTGKKSVTNIESDAVLVEATLDVRVERYSTNPTLEGSDTGAEKVFLWMPADDFARLEEISTAHSARQIAEEQDAPHESPTVPDGLRQRQNFRDLVERVRPDIPRTLVETANGRVDARLENETAEQLVLSILADYSKRPEITIPAGEPRQPDMLAAGKSTGGGVVDRAPGIERVLPEVRRLLRESAGNELASLTHDKRALVETQLSSVFGASALFGLFNGELRDVTKTIRVGDQLVTIKVRPELGALIGTGKVEKATVDFTAKNAIRGEIKAKAGTQQRIGVESGAAIGTKRKDFWRNIGFLFGASAQFSHGYSSTAAQSYKVNRRAKYKGPAVTFDRQVTWSISVSTKATTPETEQPESQTEQTEQTEAQTVQLEPWYRWLGLFRGQANRSDAPNNGDIELTTLSDRSSTSDSDSDSVRSSSGASTSSSATTTGSSTIDGWTRVLVPEPLAPTTAQGDLTNLGTVIRDFDYADQDDNPFQVKVEFLMPQGVATPSTVLSEPIEDILHNLAGTKQHDATPDPEDPLAAPLDQLLAPGGLPITGGRVRLRLFDAHPIDTVSDKLSLEGVAEGGLKLDGQETRGIGGEGRFRVPTLMQFGSKSGKRAHVAPSFTGRGTFSQEKGTTYGLSTARRRTGKTRGATHLYRAHAVFEITSYGESDAAAKTEQIAVNGGVEFLLADAVAQRLHTNPAREPDAEGQPPQTRHLDLPAGVAAKPKPATEVRYPPEFVLSGAALGPTIVTEISNAHEVAPLIKSMISDHAPGFGTGRWLEVPTGIGGSVETLASSTALGARFGQGTTSGTSLLAARPYLGGTETIEFVVRARYAPDAQATPNTEIKSDTFFQNTEKRAQTEYRSSGGGLIGSVLAARSFNGKLRRAGAHPDAGYGKEWSRSQRDTDSDAFKRRLAAEDETSYSYTWPTWFQVEMYRSWTPNAVLNNLLLTAPRRGVEMWSAMRDDTRTPEQRRFTSDGTALFTIPGGLTTTTPPAPRPVRISGRPVPVGGAVELGSLPQDLHGIDVIPLALPGSERLFPWLAAVLAHTTQQPTDDADPASSEPLMQAPAGSGWVRPATLPAQLLWQLGGEEGLTAMTQELLDGPVPFPAMVETGMVWDDEHGLAVRLRFAEVEYVNSFTATGGLTHEQKTEQEVTQTDTSNRSATLPGLAMVQGSGSKAKSGKSGNLAGDMLLPGESSTLDPSGGVSGSRSKPRVQVSTRGNAREVTAEMKGTYHVYRAGKAIYTLTDQTEHRTLFAALPGKPAEVEVTIDNGGYFAVESAQAAANNLPGPPPEPSPPASAPAPAPVALPDVWTPNADDQDAAALLPKVGGHLVVGLTASGDNRTVPELAARIEQLPGWARRPIVLVGTDGSLDLAGAAQLRDILGVDVIAADQEVWHAADGRVVTGDLSFVRSGLPTWSEWTEARLGGEVRSATAGHWYLLSAAGGMRQLPGADLASALASSGSSVQAGTAPRFDFRWGVRSAPVSLPIHGATETAEYSGWTRSPHHAAAVPEGSRPLLVLGHDGTVIPNAEVTELRSTGADVLARVNRGRGPKWMLHRADGSRPRPVEPPTELTRSPRPEPLLFRGPGDSTETIEQAAESAPDLPDDTQIVGVHVTPDGRAVLPDGREVTPEEFADEVRNDRRFVPGLAVALLGCGAHRRLVPGELTFAERLARAMGTRVWTARVDVVQTADELVHATKVSVAEDGKVLPKFVDGLGTGHWYLLGPEGQQLWRSGPELRAAVNGSAPPRYVNGAPPAVIRWTRRQSGSTRELRLQKERDRQRNRRAGLSEDARAKERGKDRDRQRARRAGLSEDARADELQTHRERMRVRRAGLSEADRAKERGKDRDRQRARRAGLSEAALEEKRRRRRGRERLKRERNKLIADAEVLLGDAQARLAVLPEWDGSRQAELGRIEELEGVLDELRKEKIPENLRDEDAAQDSGSSDEASAGEPAAASVPDAARETESGAREKEERASLVEWVAQVRASLEEVQSRQAWFALQDADFVLQVESGLPMFDEAMRDEREELQRQLGNITEDVVVELNRLVGLLDGHLAALPADFRPDVRTKVDDARQWAQLGSWTPEQVDKIASKLEGMLAAEQYLRNFSTG
ncbi:protein-glutamine glutaminase family protein [Saccharopolyspora shandongensis]|uniref:protein-glutamine glutaminase family protein n=1 Tax=Saccharopolyspora shandongensis TaxID=418495 RepID=UPI00343B8A82